MAAACPDKAAKLAEALRLRREGQGYKAIAKVIGENRDWVRHRLRRHAIRNGPPSPSDASVIAAGSRPSNTVALFEAACRALDEARTLIEVTDVADKAAALKEYGRLAKDRRLEIDAAELRIRAERRLGEMLGALALRPGRPAKNGADIELFPQPPKLADIGIDRKLSARAQRLASISQAAIEARLARWRVNAERGAERISLQIMRDGDKRERRAARERQLGEKIAAGNLDLPQQKYGVILADPEWRFEPWSRATGLDRAADNHYATSATEIIAARPVSEIAADDCVLFLWATAPMLPPALAVMTAWGFTYRTHAVWFKQRTGRARGPGYWFTGEHELLLLGTQGAVPAPAQGDNWRSVIVAPVGRHSEKPDIVHELIEAYFPSLPKIELNARRARPSWDRWGFDAPITAEPGSPNDATAPRADSLPDCPVGALK